MPGSEAEIKCKCNMPEKEMSNTRVVTTLLIVDGSGFSINDRVPMTTKITTSQKDEYPRTEDKPPAKCAPRVPKRF
jgi:hypothetical protein